jgi:hypothetical protein
VTRRLAGDRHLPGRAGRRIARRTYGVALGVPRHRHLALAAVVRREDRGAPAVAVVGEAARARVGRNAGRDAAPVVGHDVLDGAPLHLVRSTAAGRRRPAGERGRGHQQRGRGCFDSRLQGRAPPTSTLRAAGVCRNRGH